MKSMENRAKDLPGSFTENLRVIVEGDASAFEFLLTLLLVSHVVFLFCVSISAFFFRFFTLFSEQHLYSLSAGFLSRFS
jgi:hypothetical protein